MAGVVDLAAWRRARGPGEERLDRAVSRLEEVLASREWDPPPPWLVTELLAIQGCLSVGLLEDAAWRADRLSLRLERVVTRPGRVGAP